MFGQGASSCHYNPLTTFGPLTLPEPVNRYRSSNGAPGPDYWQNRADYEIHAELDPDSKQLKSTETITYTNNSPDTLPSLWLQLDQNTYRENARSLAITGRKSRDSTTGLAIDEVKLHGAAASSKLDFLVTDTRMQVRLRTPLRPHSLPLKIDITYSFTVPGEFGDRTSWGTSRNGPIFDVAQWYPRMAVYDDLHGWDTEPYLASEFYLEYGTFDYFVTLPSDMVVAGSGELVNPDQVLTAEQRRRLIRARQSNTTVVIRSADEISADHRSPSTSKKLTWHYRMEQTRDVAFSASRAFIWDAARINLPDGKSAVAMSFYPAESAGNDAWTRSTEYLKDAVEHFSERWYPYPYPVAVNVAGPSSGMEYPGLLFDGVDDKGKDLFWITAHEIGHTWFPMIVGFNERRNAWMDEGFNTFIDTFESEDFQKGIFGPKRDSEYAPGGGNPVDEILPTLTDPHAPTMMNRADAIEEKYRHPISYFKSALGLTMLRNQVLGPKRFDWAFRKFIRDWAFRHPSPSDFFRAIESEGGEDLSWFWRGWYMNNWTLDLSIKDLTNMNADQQQGASLTIENCGQLVMPSTLRVNYTDGSHKLIALPVETWIQSSTYKVDLGGGKPVKSVEVDPDHVLPDVNRANNVLPH
jgi:hypothetical protein